MPQWTRREFSALASAATLAQAPGAPRPNILWLSLEDISPDLGCYGDSYAVTPNMDRFAAQGARYTRAFTVAGVCAPSRSGIITGMYPCSIGTHHMRSKGVPPPYVKCFTEYLRAAGYCTNNVKTDYNFDPPRTAWDESSAKAHWKNRPPGQPFFAVFNHTVTHESQIRAPEEQYRKNTARLKPNEFHDPAKAALPPYYPDTPIVRRDWARYHDNLTAADYQIGDRLRELEDAGLAANTVVFIWGDHGRGLPRAKRWIYDSGILAPLLIRWPGVIAPGSVRDELVSFLDFGPTVLNIAGVPLPKHFQAQPFLGPNLPPPRRYIHAARDRMDEAYDTIRCVRDKQFKYIRNFEPARPYAQYIHYMEQMPTMQEMRRMNAERGGYAIGRDGVMPPAGPPTLFFRPSKPEEELYDITRDPHEIRNLAGDPRYRSDLDRLRKAQQDWARDIGDLGLIPEPELLERMRPGGRWAVTAEPVIEAEGGKVRLRCPTDGASIAYTTETGTSPHWQLYHRELALPPGTTLRAVACRLGYKDSREVARRL